jgi:predicted ribosomally synthesized peptide with SipW-like signal peptide
MQRIILSLSLIVLVTGALVYGATNAFFSDTETSTGNIFTAGAIDLTIDNDSYYNGVATSTTSWKATDLTIEKFFNFFDLKPDDYGEDTISLHVDTNDAYMCANVTLTSDNDNGLTEPEGLVDVTQGPIGGGELADLVHFIWWADDGDNVFENDEEILSEGPIGGLVLNQPHPIALADSDENIWTGVGGPVPGGVTQYLGKAWCFGTIGTAPVPTDAGDQGRSPAGDNNNNQIAGEPEDGGITCNGTSLGNESQTDSLTADVVFEAVQARHNEGFQCEQPRPQRATLTLIKEVINDDFGETQATAWTLYAQGASTTNPSGTTGSIAVTGASVVPGTYTLSEDALIGYSASSWSCVVNGAPAVLGDMVTLNDGDIAVCTITNDDSEPLACQAVQSYADTVVSSDIGVRKNNTSINVDRTDPADALGAPQSTGAPFDSPVVAGSFFSLGFDEGTDLTPNEGGKIVLSFNDNYIIDGPGNDIRAWEVTGGTSYPVEMLKVEVSQDGSTWYTASPALLRDEEADMSVTPLNWAKYVRLTDVSVRTDAGYPADADGYDLDAVSALNCATLQGVN